jgi:hypothetical protein
MGKHNFVWRDMRDDALEIARWLVVSEKESCILRDVYEFACVCDVQNDDAELPRSLLSLVYLHKIASKTVVKVRCRDCHRVYEK